MKINMLLLKRNKIILLLLIITSLLSSCSSWKLYDTDQFGEYRQIHFSDYLIRFKVAPKDYKMKTKNEVFYFWFAGDRIVSTQGAYSENLLQGEFTAVYNNKNLKEKGEYYYGRKNKTWRSWNKNGELIEISNWKKGIKHGMFITYKNGEIIDKNKYRNNKLIPEKEIKEKVEKVKKEKAVKSKGKESKQIEKKPKKEKSKSK